MCDHAGTKHALEPTMPARRTGGDHGPEICCAISGPNNCTKRDQNQQ